MKIKEHVKGRVKFVKYQDATLYYKTETEIQFAVPIEDTGGAVFLNEDKALFFMRWIRKHLELLSDNEPV